MIKKSDQILSSIEIEKPISVKITPSKQLVPTKITYKNFFNKKLKPNHETISSYKQLGLKNLRRLFY